MYAVIEIPAFALQAVLREKTERPAGAWAVLDESGESSRVAALNAAARRRGVVEGMRPAQALARCGELAMEARRAEAEAGAERLLLLVARSFAPRVERSAPGLASLDLKGTSTVDRSGRAHALLDRLRDLGLRGRMGIAGTPDHARWAAATARPVRLVEADGSFLDELPIESAGLEDSVTEVLESWGVRSLGAFGRLPRAGVGERLGRGGLELWDAVAGRRMRLLRNWEPDPVFRRRRDLEHRVETLPALLFRLRRFVDELALELEAARAAAFGLHLRLGLEDESLLEKAIEVPEASARAETLFRVLESALESVRTREAITSVELELQTTEARARQADLFAVAMEDAAGFARSADRVAAVVGPGRSGSPRVADTWRPDAFHMERLDAEIHPAPGQPADRAARTGLPYRRFRPPRPLRVFSSQGAPVELRGPGPSGPVEALRGPWRSSGGWWDAGAWTREEWDVELAGGGLYRIFRDGGGWFLEGAY